MTPLESRLHAQILNDGPLSFADFMRISLYDSDHGYYGSGKAQLGRSGDFYTSVSVGPLFGKMLARQFAEMWELAERPPVWTLVEQGAYNGQLALDILNALKIQSPDCYAATSLWLIEPFSVFEQQQVQTLAAYQHKVHWYKSPAELPSFAGVYYSNELLDAFPVHRVQRSAGEWQELRIESCDQGFRWLPVPITEPKLKEAAQHLPDVPEGFCMEINLPLQSWLAELFLKLERGWLLAFDYGMSAMELALPHRKDGTVAGYKNHKRIEDPLLSPGEIDLTAHVNFTALASQATEEGWDLVGYTDQHRFFTGLAPLHFKDASEELSVEEQKERLAFRSLTHPQLMGVQFKVLGLSKKMPPPAKLTGFAFARPANSSLGLDSI